MEEKKSFWEKIPEKALFGFWLAVILFYASYLFLNAFVWEDSLYIFYPGANYLAKNLANGHFPLWISGLRLGVPFYSDVQMGVFYPLNWLLTLFVSDGVLSIWAYQSFLLFHIGLGGSFLYFFLRKGYKTSEFSAVIGAIIFAFSGFMSLQIIHVAFFEVMVWAPLALLFAKKAAEDPKLKHFIWLALSVVMTVLPGSPQITVYFAYLLIAYYIFNIVLKLRSEEKKGKEFLLSGFLSLLKLGGVYLSVFLIAAVALAPAAENWSRSFREEFTYEDITQNSLEVKNLIEVLVPNFFGATFPDPDETAPNFWGDTENSEAAFFGVSAYWQYWEFGFYFGQAALVLIVMMLFNLKVFEDKKHVLFFSAVLIAALWFSLGKNGGLFWLLYHVLPGVSFFRSPSRMSSVTDLAAAISAALILTGLIEKKDEIELKKPLMTLSGIFGLFAVILLIFGRNISSDLSSYSNRSFAAGQLFKSIAFSGVLFGLLAVVLRAEKKTYRTLAMIALALISFFDLYLAYSKFSRGQVDPRVYYADSYGLINDTKSAREFYGDFRIGQYNQGMIVEDWIFPKNLPYFESEMEFEEGYILFYLDETLNFRDHVDTQTRISLENMAYLFSYDATEGQFLTIPNTDSLPRMKFYSSVATFNSADEIYDALSNQNLDYHSVIGVLKSDVDQAFSSDLISNLSSVDYEKNSAENYQISITAESPGLLFISQNYYPGWTAVRSATGEELDVIPAFGTFTGIVIPEAGIYQVEFEFKPKVLKVSLLISLLSLAAATTLLVLLKRKEKAEK